MRKRARIRAAIQARYWHIVLCAIAGAGIFTLVDSAYLIKLGELPSLRKIWGFAALIPALCGAVVTLGAGGAEMWKRVVGAAICGSAVGIFYTALSVIIGHSELTEVSVLATNCVWRVFIFTILSTAGMLATEVRLPEPTTGSI